MCASDRFEVVEINVTNCNFPADLSKMKKSPQIFFKIPEKAPPNQRLPPMHAESCEVMRPRVQTSGSGHQWQAKKKSQNVLLKDLRLSHLPQRVLCTDDQRKNIVQTNRTYRNPCYCCHRSICYASRRFLPLGAGNRDSD